MRITTNFEVASVPKRNGLYPIFLRVTENSKHHKMALGVYVQNKKNFTPHAKHKAWISTKEPMAKVYNAKLEDALLSYNDVERELSRRGELTAANIIKNLKQDNSDSVISYIDRKYSQQMNLGRYSSATTRKELKRYLLLFSKGKDITFNDITVSFVESFEEFLCVNKSRTGNPLGRNTINKYLFMFKSIYKQATEDNMVISNRNPFAKMKLKKESASRCYLTPKEVDDIINLELEQGSELWHVRNYFLFSFYSAGMRVGDLITLKWENITETHIVYKMRKTSHVQPVLLTDKAKEILSLYKKEGLKQTDFIFPIISSGKPNIKKASHISKDYAEYSLVRAKTTLLNHRLKKLVYLTEIEKNVSFHIARHSFAHYVASTSGDIRLIQNLLGHSSTAMTDNYLRGFNITAQDKFMSSIFNE